ncbi:MAG TPA: alpha/beta hydrolase, partial [Desulforhopalus sp.]|nr:alpha/beta hydrolase [Desulforhopalus sp.]
VAKAYIAPYDSWQNRVAIASFVRDIPLTEGHPSYSTLVAIEESLAALCLADIPMLIAWGGRDFCFNESFYREWLQRFPQAQAHYFPDGGHYILEDEWPQLRLLISGFFRSASPGVG